MRWKIEIFHKILKSGCKAEESKLRTADGLTKLTSIFCILSWRIFWMTMMNRENQSLSAKVAFTASEINLLALLRKLVRSMGSIISEHIKFSKRLLPISAYLAKPFY